jgi:hypothetical protein
MVPFYGAPPHYISRFRDCLPREKGKLPSSTPLGGGRPFAPTYFSLRAELHVAPLGARATRNIPNPEHGISQEQFHHGLRLLSLEFLYQALEGVGLLRWSSMVFLGGYSAARFCSAD